MSDPETTPCRAAAHLGYGSTLACDRPAHLVLVWKGGTVAACRACAAVFVMHHYTFWVLPFPEFPVSKEVGALQLSGKVRSVYLYVLHGIQGGRWQPGQPVPYSSELATACRCARSTATKGLRALVADGWLIAADQYGGYTVAAMEQWPQPAAAAPAVRLVQNRTIDAGEDGQ